MRKRLIKHNDLYIWIIFIFIANSCSKKMNIKNNDWVLLSRIEKYKEKQIKKVIIDTFDINKINKLKYAIAFKCDQHSKLPLKSVIESLITKDSLESLILLNIDTLPSNVVKLKNLKSLYIGGRTLITELPEDIDKLENLKSLDLGTPFSHFYWGGYISKIPPNLFKLKNLQFLSLHGNPITFLPKEICGFEKLFYLNLNGTKIDSLPNCICFRKNIIIKTNNDSIYNKLPCKEDFKPRKGVPIDSIPTKELKKIPKWRINFNKWFIENIMWNLGF